MEQRVVFLAASDDMNWMKENLLPVQNDVYFTGDLFGQFNVYLFAVVLKKFRGNTLYPTHLQLGYMQVCNEYAYWRLI